MSPPSSTLSRSLSLSCFLFLFYFMFYFPSLFTILDPSTLSLAPCPCRHKCYILWWIFYLFNTLLKLLQHNIIIHIQVHACNSLFYCCDVPIPPYSSSSHPPPPPLLPFSPSSSFSSSPFPSLFLFFNKKIDTKKLACGQIPSIVSSLQLLHLFLPILYLSLSVHLDPYM